MTGYLTLIQFGTGYVVIGLEEEGKVAAIVGTRPFPNLQPRPKA